MYVWFGLFMPTYLLWGLGRGQAQGERAARKRLGRASSSPADAMRTEIGVGVARRPGNNVTPLSINIFVNLFIKEAKRHN